MPLNNPAYESRLGPVDASVKGGEMLKFGMMMFPIHDPRFNATMQLGQDIDLAVHADRIGMDEFWFGEHHSGGWQVIADPMLMCAQAAALTSRIRLGSGVATLAYHHPKTLLESAIQLSHQTRGRFMFGVGAGALALDSMMMGLDPRAARTDAEASLECMNALLRADGPVTMSSPSGSWRTQDAWLHLMPFGGSKSFDMRAAVFNSPSGAVLAGRFGLGVISFGAAAAVGLGQVNRLQMAAERVQMVAEHHGNTFDRSRWSIMSPVHIAETEEKAREQVRHRISGYFDYLRQILPFNVPVGSDPDDLIDTMHLVGHGVVGTPEMAENHIRRIQEMSGGFGTFLIEHTNWANHRDTTDSMSLFMEQVSPRFTGDSDSRIAAHARENQGDQMTRRTMASSQTASELAFTERYGRRLREVEQDEQ